MAHFELRLLEVPTGNRQDVMDAARNFGPPFDRPAFNAVMMGTTAPPQPIATAASKEQLAELMAQLAAVGCKVDVVGAKAAVAGGAGDLVSKFTALPLPAKIAAGVAPLLLLVGLAKLMGDDAPPPPPRDNSMVRTSTMAKSKTATVAPKAGPKPTPVSDFVATLRPADDKCSAGTAPFACLVEQLRTIEEALPAGEVEVVDAGLPEPPTAVDAGTVDDAGDLVPPPPPPPPPLDPQEYVKVLQHRVFRCLAEERTKPEKGDEAVTERAITSLLPALVYRVNGDDCTENRGTMYDCMAEDRKATCKDVWRRIQGAVIELGQRGEVADWTAEFADAVGDKLLRCAKEERGVDPDPMLRAGMHLFRYEVATALTKAPGGCAPQDYVRCGVALTERPCRDVSAGLSKDPKAIISKMADACGALESCR